MRLLTQLPRREFGTRRANRRHHQRCLGYEIEPPELAAERSRIEELGGSPAGAARWRRETLWLLSFRVADEDAVSARMWAERLGVDRSELLRDALRRHLLRLASEIDAQTWSESPLSEGERSLSHIADWGPAEDWFDWVDATR